MKINVTVKCEKDVHYLRAQCGVRYWEDAEVNGQPEVDEAPTIPCRNGDAWCPVIDLETGIILDWPEDVTAKTHYKVCDDGRYDLLDADKNVVLTIAGYVPAAMCPGGDGYGDYVIMEIGAGGKIANWQFDPDDFAGGGE